MKPTRETLIPSRVWDAIEPDDTSGCWLWLRSTNGAGYAQSMISGRMWRVHRLVYIDQVGPIPPGLVLDHLCRVRHCVNPGHLEPVTDRVNVVERGIGPSARRAAATRCERGHPFDERNTARTASGHRSCRACHLANYHARSAEINAHRSRRIKCAACGKDLAWSSQFKHREYCTPA